MDIKKVKAPLILKPLAFKSKKIKKHYSNHMNSFNILDIGAGNHSSTRFKQEFKNCKYYGVDREEDYENNKNDLELMEKLYIMDLTKLDFSTIPDNFFEVICMAHVIEHLYNGELVIQKLLSKLKQNGILYIEYPAIKSVSLPSMYGTLNFFDDKTHCRLYSMHELLNMLMDNGFKICEAGTRRDKFRILLMPLSIIRSLFKHMQLKGGIFWDITGFAEFIVAKKL